MRVLKVADGPIYRLAYTPDGRSLVIQTGLKKGSGEQEPVRSVRWWSWPEGREEFAWKVTGVATFSPDHGLIVAPRGSDRENVLFVGQTLDPVADVRLEGGWVDFGFSPDCQWLV